MPLCRVIQVSLTSYRQAVNLFLNERNSIVIKIYQLVKMSKTYLCLHFFSMLTVGSLPLY